MTDSRSRQRRLESGMGLTAAALCLLLSCAGQGSNRVQGYVEGEFVYVASPLAGQLQLLNVQRGDSVKTGDPLFTLDNTAESAVLDQAREQLTQARSTLEDLRKPRRPTEIESIEAQLRRARAAYTFSQKEFERQERLAQTGARSAEDLDRSRSLRDQDRQHVAQLEADLETANLGSRVDQIKAAEATVQAQEAAVARANWDFSQKSQAAPQTGAVFDTLFRQGEWVPAGRPVVVILPPQNIKVRAFVPETQIGKIHVGDPVRVWVDGVPKPFAGKVSFISPRAEFTPPVIYSQESRAKLVFMVESVFDPQIAANLHPGQPVDVQFGE